MKAARALNSVEANVVNETLRTSGLKMTGGSYCAGNYHISIEGIRCATIGWSKPSVMQKISAALGVKQEQLVIS